MISTSSKVINNNEFNSVIRLINNDKNHVTDNETPINKINDIPEEKNNEMLIKERRAEKSERRVNDNRDYRGPARRLTIDRRK